MVEIPRHLNTKFDYEYIRAHFPPEKWKPRWQELLSREYWDEVAELEDEEPGIEDAKHKVVQHPPKKKQLALKPDPKANIHRLGFDVAEVEAALAE